MSSIQIDVPKDYSKSRIVVDGVDITKSVLAKDIAVQIAAGPGEQSRVTLTLLADEVRLSLASAEIEATTPPAVRRLCDKGEI